MDTKAETALAERFLSHFMTDEVATSFNMKQFTCTVQDHRYWAEQIRQEENDGFGEENEAGSNGEEEVDDAETPESISDHDEEEFGF